ncbi:prepilin peptidase [Cylindrospermopsis raciborskii]|uniref:Prepilin leader peptidase/N-methyltransferase n=1 Tax=Cylindrospermopsis raciborskii CENA302 TaxID=1170768 RepID=A0A9Q5QWT2_9CYAN|nr:A24 family peptidase [Cylindrospermopsis raciborskii]NLQ05762.1 prepilin peptidase [Cylindrospermopsis raciborskii MVCC19]OHY36473.1 methyltransferase [Cylindrospermopsis raciborskii MVCC14]OPH09968.1 prepilin peptidase [Cylindrospermopsis raciborskii CENA302]
MDIMLNLVPSNIIVLVLGACVGSFINVVVYRLPRGLSLLWPSSHCPHCLNPLKVYHNLPIVGWLWLRGKCADCQSKISYSYPLVELLTGIIFLIVFWVFQFSLLTIGYWVFCSWLLALSLIDWETMTLPGSLTKSGLVLGLIFQTTLGYVAHNTWSSAIGQLIWGIGGMVLGLWLFDIITSLGFLFYGKPVMGGGDGKLAAMMGAWLGWQYLLVASFIACFSGVLIGCGAIIVCDGQIEQKMPFGPFLAWGSVISIFGGEIILDHYLRFVLSHS